MGIEIQGEKSKNFRMKIKKENLKLSKKARNDNLHTTEVHNNTSAMSNDDTMIINKKNLKNRRKNTEENEYFSCDSHHKNNLLNIK